MTVDGPMYRKLFIEMTPQEQGTFVSALQERRLRVVQIYRDAQALKQAALDERSMKQVSTHCGIMEKDIATIERAMSRIEERMIKISALRAMIGATLPTEETVDA